MQVHIVPLFSDNFAYLIAAEGENEAAVVDPAEPDKILAAADALGLKITTILTTHQHWDHAGGNINLIEKLQSQGVSPTVYGGKGDKIPGVTHELSHNDVFQLGSEQQLKVVTYFTPCHTPGHVLFHVTCDSAAAPPSGSNPEHPFSIPVSALGAVSSAAAGHGSSDAGPVSVFSLDSSEVSSRGIVFTGDTLFIGGCGNFNKGTPEQMRYALVDVIGSLPAETLLAVGHEYTAKNFAYASTVEPGNQALLEKKAWVAARRDAGLPTTPSTVQQELATNIFMRLEAPEVVKYAVGEGAKVRGEDTTADAVEVIRQLRASKSAWRG